MLLIPATLKKQDFENKDDLVKEYHYFYTKIFEIHISFDTLKKTLDGKSLYYLPIFAKRNNTPSKTFLWTMMIFYETMDYPHFFVYKKDFNIQLFSLMNLNYNLGQKYFPSIYDVIVYDSSTYSNHFICFPSAAYIRPLIDELTKLEYPKFIQLLKERFIEVKILISSSPVQLIKEIGIEPEKKKRLLMLII